MTLPASGNAISINSLVGEYGGSAPHSMSEYYKGGGLVANHSNNANVPTSGTISLSNFHGQSNTSPAPTSYSYVLTLGNGGFGSVVGFSAPTNIGSLTNNPQSTAFASGFNPTWMVIGSFTSIGKGGASITDLRLIANSSVANSGWTRWFIPSGIINLGNLVGNKTLLRTDASHSISGSQTTWEWASQSFSLKDQTSGTIVINA